MLGSGLAITTSVLALTGSILTSPPLAIPFFATSLYASQKFLNNTYYKSFDDLAFVAKKKKDTVKIYQDIVRPDMFRLVKGLDTREKLGFLQLQTLVGMTKFDIYDKKGNPITLETDSHGIIRNTFQKLAELGYLQNYQEKYLKNHNLLFEKLAFGNTNIKKKTATYNMSFQRTEKPIDFDDPNFRKMFPAVFSKRGLLAKQGYSIKRDDEGRLVIDYSTRNKQSPVMKKTNPLRERTKVDISLEKQNEFVREVLDKEQNQPVITENREK